jgi:phosphoribosylaminoimidazole-succinocarboxamide synthase
MDWQSKCLNNGGKAIMKLVYSGKTKDVFELDENRVLLQFKDDATGENGKFDPGANTVGLSIPGVGKAGLKLTTFFFNLLNNAQIPTHFIESDLNKVTMIAKKATLFGKGLEVICRYRAVGSFLKRYGQYIESGAKLPAFVEVTLKDDDRNDPPITEDALELLGILSKAEYQILKQLTQKISGIIRDELKKRNLELYDIKLEFGRVGSDQKIVLIDEISGGNMRVYHEGHVLEPLELERQLFSES